MRKQMQNGIYAGNGKNWHDVWKKNQNIDKKRQTIEQLYRWKKKDKKNDGDSKNKGRKTRVLTKRWIEK